MVDHGYADHGFFCGSFWYLVFWTRAMHQTQTPIYYINVWDTRAYTWPKSSNNRPLAVPACIFWILYVYEMWLNVMKLYFFFHSCEYLHPDLFLDLLHHARAHRLLYVSTSFMLTHDRTHVFNIYIPARIQYGRLLDHQYRNVLKSTHINCLKFPLVSWHVDVV